MLTSIYQHLRLFLAPPFCAYCKCFMQQETVLCPECFKHISPIVSVTVPVTKTYSMKVFAIADYQEPLKSLILAKGWSDHIASYQLGQLIWQLTHVRRAAVDFFVPIPLHWTRYAYRGFNQTEEIARVLARNSGKPMITMLRRNKRTLFQAGLSKQMRQENVKQIFGLTIEPTKYYGKHLMLVDDLMTTGSTLRMAAKELSKLKPASISAVVACRVI